ncbi:Centaurin-gamma-1A, partial [Trichinella pseudospiralis]
LKCMNFKDNNKYSNTVTGKALNNAEVIQLQLMTFWEISMVHLEMKVSHVAWGGTNCQFAVKSRIILIKKYISSCSSTCGCSCCYVVKCFQHEKQKFNKLLSSTYLFYKAYFPVCFKLKMMSRQYTYDSTSTISEQIRNEIQRFESVHPCIYAIYDLLELILDAPLAQQLRENVVQIEDSFVNSQEWTCSRAVPELRLGFLGSLSSGKSSLVHRYLTGSFIEEESPEGGRFKKEVLIDGQPYLLLIRDEGGPPEQQFAHWVDAVVFVFSLEDEASFNAVYHYYAKMAHYRNTAEIPLILVGTKDGITENNPRVIDESRARKLANDLKRCAYYETFATYGINVGNVFHDACCKIIHQRLNQQTSSSSTISGHLMLGSGSVPNSGTPSSAFPASAASQRCSYNSAAAAVSPTPTSSAFVVTRNSPGSSSRRPASATLSGTSSSNSSSNNNSNINNCNNNNNNNNNNNGNNIPNLTSSISMAQTPFSRPSYGNVTKEHSLDQFKIPRSALNSGSSSKDRPAGSNNFHADTPDSLQHGTPASTPNAQRKNRRISNIFNRKEEERPKNGDSTGTVGQGRAIPIKQGIVYKRSGKPLNKAQWKKKYVCLYSDGRLAYYPSLKDYMENVHGKEICLGSTTVKVPGKKPQSSRTMVQSVIANGDRALANSSKESGGSALVSKEDGIAVVESQFSAEIAKLPTLATAAAADLPSNCEAGFSAPSGDETGISNVRTETPNVKKKDKMLKHSRKPSTAKSHDLEECDGGYEFIIVSLDSRQWHFEAFSMEERDEWVLAIEQQILCCLLGNESDKRNFKSRGDRDVVQALKKVAGNDRCADCNAPNPDWASLNLGTLICIQCSGIHRNLGTHISKVRSLDLDEWAVEHIRVMQALGNDLVNRIWEHDTGNKVKPLPNSSREVKEQWIRAKYETKEFLAPVTNRSVPLNQMLMDAICKQDLPAVFLILAHCTSRTINSTLSSRDLRTPLHLSCAVGNPIITQLLIWIRKRLIKNRVPRFELVTTHAVNAAHRCTMIEAPQSPPAQPPQPMPRRSIVASHSAESNSPKSCGDVFENLPSSKFP